MATSATTRRFTAADLEALPDDGNRYELLDGLLLVTPAPVPEHQLAQTTLQYAFHDAGAFVLPAPVDVAFADDTVLQPDLVVWRERPATLRPLPTPELVVEVGSPTTRRRDLTLKRDRYAAEGIAEFWFVDLREERLLVHRLVDGAYVATDDEPATSDVVAGVAVSFADLDL